MGHFNQIRNRERTLARFGILDQTFVVIKRKLHRDFHANSKFADDRSQHSYQKRIKEAVGKTTRVRDCGELPRMSSGVLAAKSAEFHSLRFDPEKRIDVSTLTPGHCNHQSQS